MLADGAARCRALLPLSTHTAHCLPSPLCPSLPAPRAPPPGSAERFGTNFRDPGRRKEFRLDARRERLATEGFATGINLFSEVGGPGGGGGFVAGVAQRGWGGDWRSTCSLPQKQQWQQS
jgi:hypothetical protein